MNEEEREELENAVSLQISKQLLRIKKITTKKNIKEYKKQNAWSIGWVCKASKKHVEQTALQNCEALITVSGQNIRIIKRFIQHQPNEACKHKY